MSTKSAEKTTDKKKFLEFFETRNIFFEMSAVAVVAIAVIATAAAAAASFVVVVVVARPS